jgi:hypothetical protein
MLKNHGNTKVYVNLDAIPLALDLNVWDILLSTRKTTVDPFSSKSFTLSMTPSQEATAYDSALVMITANSVGTSSELLLETTVALLGEFIIETDDTQKNADPGEAVYYLLTVTNMQNSQDTIDITASSPNDWNIHILESNGVTLLKDTDQDGTPDTGALAPFDGTVKLRVAVEIPDDGKAYSTDESVILFASSLQDGRVESATLVTEVGVSGEIVLTPEEHSRCGDPGNDISYLIWAKNMINCPSSIDIIASSEYGWEVGLFDEDGSPLKDNDGNGIVDTGDINSFGGEKAVYLLVSVPENSKAYTKDVITVTGTSCIDDEMSHSIILDASTNRICRMSLALDGGELSVETGEKVNYIFTISNDGNHGEAIRIHFLELPEGWRYQITGDDLFVPYEETRSISVLLEIPSDAEPGTYQVKVAAVTETDETAGDLMVEIEVQEDQKEFEPFILWLLLLIIIAVSALIIAFLILRNRKQGGAVIHPGSSSVGHAVYEVQTFPAIEEINCPDCRFVFEVEVTQRPFNIKCPNCGISGVIR